MRLKGEDAPASAKKNASTQWKRGFMQPAFFTPPSSAKKIASKGNDSAGSDPNIPEWMSKLKRMRTKVDETEEEAAGSPALAIGRPDVSPSGKQKGLSMMASSVPMGPPLASSVSAGDDTAEINSSDTPERIQRVNQIDDEQ